MSTTTIETLDTPAAPAARGPHLPPKARMKAKPASKAKAKTTEELTDETIKELTDVFKILSDPSRLKVLMALASSGELHVSALCDRLGTETASASQPAVSHHLTLLRMARLVSFRREGKFNYYRLNSTGLADVLERLFKGVGDEKQRIPLGDFVLAFERE